jgi:hypothetical protein
MDQITLLFTRRNWNPVSWLIRWAVPRSRFALALSSHCIIVARGRYFEADMFAGVREGVGIDMLKNHIVTRSQNYAVDDVDAGLAWILTQLCPYIPNPPAWLPAWAQRAYAFVDLFFHSNYDWSGAAGLGLAPYRDWADPSKWFCYELAAGFLRACGRSVFSNLTHVGETALLAIEP